MSQPEPLRGDDLITVREKMENFIMTAPVALLRDFHDALAQRRLALARALLPSLYVSAEGDGSLPPSASLTKAELQQTAIAFYHFIHEDLPSNHKDVEEVEKFDHEDLHKKRISIMRLKQPFCEGCIAIRASVTQSGEGYTAFVVLTLAAFHRLDADLRKAVRDATTDASPSTTKTIVLPTTPLINLTHRKFQTGEDCDGEWAVKVDALPTNASSTLQLRLTMKMRSELVPTIGTITSRLPPLPEEEDDICEAVRFTDLTTTQGTFGQPRLPRDPRRLKDKLPKAAITRGSNIEPVPERPEKFEHSVKTKDSEENNKPLASFRAKAVQYNQDMYARDGKFKQWVFFVVEVNNTSETRQLTLLKDDDTVVSYRRAKDDKEERATVDYGVAVQERGPQPYRWHEIDGPIQLPADGSGLFMMRIGIECEGTPGNGNYERSRLHPAHFGRDISFNIRVQEKHTDAVHSIVWEPKLAAIALPSDDEIREKSCDNAPKLLALVVADDQTQFTRHWAAAYLDSDGDFVLRREGSYHTFSRDSITAQSWQASKTGPSYSETPIDSLSTDKAKFYPLVDRSSFPPLVYGYRIVVETATTTATGSCCVEFSGEDWIEAKSMPQSDDSASTVRDLESLRSLSVDWVVVPKGNDSVAAGPVIGGNKSVASSLGSMFRSNTTTAVEGTTDFMERANSAEPTIIYDTEIGSGAYGRVYKAFDTSKGKYIAVKETQVVDDATMQRSIVAEFSRLTELKHPNIVEVFALSVSNDVARVFMEWMPAGSVSSVLYNTQFRLHESVIRRYVADVLRGLKYLHENSVVHLDIKPGNMLCAPDGSVKLADFGTSKMLGNGSTMTTQQVVGTPCYMPPEMITAGKYYEGSDIWALACSVVEMASGKLPWSHLPAEVSANHVPLMFHIGTAQPPNHHPLIPEHLSKDLRELLMSCFTPTFASRPTPAALLTNPYFASDALPADAESVQAYNDAVAEFQASAEVQTDAPPAPVTIGDVSLGPVTDKTV